MNTLWTWNERLFFLVNRDIANRGLDGVMRAVTWLGAYPWIWIIGLLLLFAIGKSRERQAGTALLIAVLLSNTLAEVVLKPLFAHPRPFLHLSGVRLLFPDNGHLSLFGFPSSHAANIMAAATVLFLWFRHWTVRFGSLLTGLAVCLSRVYIGVHCPLDVTGGALTGLALGSFVVWAWTRNQAWVDRVRFFARP